ncbi:CheW protein [Candidatus Propionivibrio aalborgensis]|jgi:twitching motility protein PilI|uniref:CheW protein n=1 Tax=Candidatus Propionivibrio aalborgensis TaxID=1860101 RepID=A0A1A8Y1P6_9RHOO|nr:chemotaxis protein CheW [Candidatus Propionivibrio aalborgensis]MBK7325861.1 chemotaxis protein CheW [Propionivibrio sp.]MBK7563657.1 chemotaxis protein CheW [Propionivibrio sp.]MBK9026895.1 chemotaxis protein CheW [Propionivibrio sp.]SBT11059.1 CheW protein [Candidatus Propionivibrio aalborgensis]HRC59426.1 chemotaxis protein CheW [Candidatus Propionivibrio aalborgensis]
MAKKGSLREFQAHLAKRLAGVSDQSAAGLLGVQAGSDFWLISLFDSGEIIPLTPLTGVPLTKPWFAGIANIRGNLYAVADFSAFQGKEATPQNASSRLLLIGTRHGDNAALLIPRVLGLRNLDDLTPVATDPDAPPWSSEAYSDNEGRRWNMLNVRRLLSDDSFMDIGV